MIQFTTSYFDRPPKEGRILDIFQGDPQMARQAAIFFVHGGGWRNGSRSIFHTIGLAFRDLGFDIATTDYRLRGVTVFEQVADIVDALTIFANDLNRRGKSRNIVMIGSSAGAHLACLAALSATRNTDAPPTNFQIVGMCLQSAPFTFEPWPDIFPGIWESMQIAMGSSFSERPDLYAKASPIHELHRNAPPILALHAENEHMFPLELTRQFLAKAQSVEVRVEVIVYPNTEHGFFYSLERRQQKQAFDDILQFMASLPTP